ncbi:DinB family protein [Pareuzebyella sediminis]|uniref:DinB family protein n=1 Tax=Pareuzebyella sediminis TaxID=2607998 RepID=UPI0018E1CBD2|nr:DinB family protein [Pareuzebyella sediminis]
MSTLNNAFKGEPWYGISVVKKLETIDWKVVGTPPEGYSKSIAVMVKHMVNWRVFVLNKLRGEPDFDIEIDSDQDWPLIKIANESEWDGLIMELRTTQKELVAILRQINDDFLKRKVPGRKYNFEYLVKGIIEHDIYHLGQIAIIHAIVKKI